MNTKQQKHAIVLCATDGLGLAIAKRLFEQGCKVTITGRNAEKAQQVAASISKDVQTLPLDLDSQQSIAAFYQLLQEDNAYDILINNTGGPKSSTTLEVEPETWEQYFQSMVLPVFEITRLIIPHMQLQGWGRVINLTSSGAVQPIPNLGISNTLRASILAWAKSLSSEVAGDGITVNSMITGRIDTKRVRHLDEVNSKRLGLTVEQMQQENFNKIPAGRYGEPEEFAAVAGFLASDDGAYVTGSLQRVDGGLISGL